MPHITLLEGVFKRIDTVRASSLKARPTIEEIKVAFKWCRSDKSPGYDGFNIKFIKRMWDIIGTIIVEFKKEIFKTSRFPKSINTTWVTLIPNTKSNFMDESG